MAASILLLYITKMESLCWDADGERCGIRMKQDLFLLCCGEKLSLNWEEKKKSHSVVFWKAHKTEYLVLKGL